MKKILFFLSFCVTLLLAEGKHVYIVHGYGSDANYGWLPYTADTLRSLNNQVILPSFPNPNTPKLKEWLEFMRMHFTKLDENTYFITHSLGGIAVLDFLNSCDKDVKIGGLIMVSPFDEPLKILPILDEFVQVKLDFKKLKKMVNHIVIISAKNDSVVPTSISQNLSKKLNAQFIQTSTGGHFMESEGFNKLPLIIDIFKKIDKN
ncbi:TPA: serine hydrolase family protein [Campylobacter jejuni]|nr:serine hydrolase family protein [Campylobacter jejuni]EAI4349781.1 serine hydrolase family protein [Campylobacter jejuni]EAI4351174.1 serine hydrolase family protein [Campylobacter jejuni]EAJ6944923.1 serine hydrolase family protein [Campylobacter jejuni]ELL7906439.1 serine hydrolase family protein [Campylobacter jejuni]